MSPESRSIESVTLELEEVKAVMRAVVAGVVLVSAQLAYGMPLGGAATARPSELSTLPESVTMALLGLAMLLVARGARRRPPVSAS